MTSEPTDGETDLVPANDFQAAQIREIALNGVETLQRTSANMQEASAATSRWILASLLAMNSGGAVAVLSASEKVVGPVGPSIVAFGIGASLAVATGLNGLVTGIRVGPIIGNSIELLRISIFESTILASTKREIGRLSPILRQQLIVSSALSTGSLGAFAAGLAMAVN